MSNQQVGNLLGLEYPKPLAVFSSYPEAQRAVDYLADRDFPVANLCIVGTDLRSIERVTGRRTWGTVIAGGIKNGISTGLMMAIFFYVFVSDSDLFSLVLMAFAIGIGFGIIFASIGYLASRGRRDFTSVSQTVATKYEVMCEHKVVQRAQEMLATDAQMIAPMKEAGYNPAAPWLAGPAPDEWNRPLSDQSTAGQAGVSAMTPVAGQQPWTMPQPSSYPVAPVAPVPYPAPPVNAGYYPGPQAGQVPYPAPQGGPVAYPGPQAGQVPYPAPQGGPTIPDVRLGSPQSASPQAAGHHEPMSKSATESGTPDAKSGESVAPEGAPDFDPPKAG